MPVEAWAVYLRLPVFALVAARLAGLIMFQPLIGGAVVPAQVRALLVIGLAALVAPFVAPHGPLPRDLYELIFALANELLLGILLGLVLRAVFVGLQLAGQLIAQESGLAFGEMVDPSTESSQSIIGGLYVQLGSLVFLLIGGHRVLVAATLDTFAAIPLLGDRGVFTQGLDMLLEAAVLGMHLAVRIAAPVVATLFLVNVALGFIGRTVPQLNILTVGFSIKGMAALLLMAVALPGGTDVLLEAFSQAVDWVDEFSTTP